MALLFRDFDKRVEIRSSREGTMRFRQRSDAANCLKQLVVSLCKMLEEHRGQDTSRLTDAQVILEAIRSLENGSLQLMEMYEPRLEAPSTMEEEPEAEAPAEMAPPPAPPALLPLLEELQIEGAEVLPEITQTLEKIDATIAGIGSATVSLAPAPSKIPAINATMQSSSASITDMLGAL
jgi:hypothetical protein